MYKKKIAIGSERFLFEDRIDDIVCLRCIRTHFRIRIAVAHDDQIDTIREVACLGCTYRVPMQEVLKRLAAGEEDPDCPDCGGILKSATISFGQSLVARDLARAEQAARACDLLLAVGSTLSVYPVAGLVPIAKESGARIVIMNGEPTAMDDIADAVLLGDLNEVLPRVLAGTAHQ